MSTVGRVDFSSILQLHTAEKLGPYTTLSPTPFSSFARRIVFGFPGVFTKHPRDLMHQPHPNIRSISLILCSAWRSARNAAAYTELYGLIIQGREAAVALME